MSVDVYSASSSIQADQRSGETSRTSLLVASERRERRAPRDESLSVQGEGWPGLASGYRVRRIGSKGALLVLLWNVASSAAGSFAQTFLSSLHVFENYRFAPASISYFLCLVYAPLAGLLGDFYFGRHKFLHYNFLLMWAAGLVSVIALLGEYLLPSSTTALALALDYGVLAPASVVIILGMSGMQVVSIPFGMDQMPDGSSDEISAFIHWLVWAQFLGQCIGGFMSIVIDRTHFDAGLLLFGLIATFSVSVILCTNYLLRSWFIVEPRCQSPVKTIAGVLRYALTHKYPVRRSALTYWEDGIPSRIDLGKTKYGGPFTNEQVEDVKTLFRVVIAAASIAAFVIPAEATLVSVSPYHYKPADGTYFFEGSFVLYALSVSIVLIPLYELLVYPLARNWIPSSLKRVAFFAFLTIAVSIYLTMLDIVGQSQAKVTVPCLFHANETSPPLPIDYTAVVFPGALLIGIQVLAFNIAAYEFICAQSPYHMKGLITGFGVMIINLAACLGDAIYLVWSYNWPRTATNNEITCGTCYYLFTMVIGFVGLALLMVVVSWYKERERDDIVNEQRFAEAYYADALRSHEN